MKASIVVIFLMLSTSQACAHNVPMGCNGEEPRPNVTVPAWYTPEQLKEIKRIEGDISKTENVVVQEHFSGVRRSGGEMPDQADAQRIPWADAERLVLMGYIVSVMQAHSLDVWLRTRSGRSYVTKEPNIDDILLLKRVVDPCDLFISWGTE